jgi:hypothetical protein
MQFVVGGLCLSVAAISWDQSPIISSLRERAVRRSESYSTRPGQHGGGFTDAQFVPPS